jgi:hypothetical protein
MQTVILPTPQRPQVPIELPHLVRVIHSVAGVVRVENRLAYDVDDRDLGRPMAYPWMRP